MADQPYDALSGTALQAPPQDNSPTPVDPNAAPPQPQLPPPQGQPIGMPSPQPQAPPVPAPQPPGSMWKNILQGALQGMAGAGRAGSKSFGGGLGAGVAGVQDAKQQQFENAQTQATNTSNIKFRDIQSAHAAAQLTAEDAQLAHMPEEYQQQREKFAQDTAIGNQKNFGIEYDVIPNTGDAATARLSSDPNGAHVPPGTIVGSKNLYIPKAADDPNSMGKQYEMVKTLGGAFGLAVPPRTDFFGSPYATRRQWITQATNIQNGKKQDGTVYKPNELPQAVSQMNNALKTAQTNGTEAAVAQITATRDNLQSQLDAVNKQTDDKRVKDTAAKVQVKGAAGSGGAKTPEIVHGSDPTGREVAGTPEELQAAGVKNFVKLPMAEAGKVTVARELTGTDGLFTQVAKDLAALGPNGLGPLSGRMNEFMSGKLGSDPTFGQQYTRLHTDLGLLSTAVMQAHVGSRGSEGMMEHFQKMADAGHMDYPTLKAALAAEFQYVSGRAMRPKAAQGGK